MGKARANARPARGEDKFELLRSGGFDITANGTRYRCGRPTIGEQRRFVEQLLEVQRAERLSMGRDPDTNEAMPADWEPDEDTPTADDVNHLVLDWWRLVVSTLSDGGALPNDDDELPAWLLHRDLIAEVRQQWLTIPWVPGGSPEDRAAAELKAAEATLAKLGPILAAAQAQ